MRKMAALCQAVGSFLRPVAASSSAGASRPGRGVTRSLTGLAAPRGPAQRSYGDRVHSVGFPPVPPPGVALDRRGASAVPARAYADDYGGGTMNQAPGYGGGTMNQAGSPARPPWSGIRNANTVTVIATRAWTRDDHVRHGRVRRSRVARGARKEADEPRRDGPRGCQQRGRRRHHVAGRGGLERRGAPAVRSRRQGAGSHGHRSTQGERVDGQGDRAEAIAHQGERVLVRVRHPQRRERR